MFFDRCLPIKSLYKVPKQKQLKLLSPHRKYNILPSTLKPDQLQYYQKLHTNNSQYEQPIPIHKSTLPRNRHPNLFLKQIQSFSKEKSHDKFLKRFDKNNPFAVQSSKNNQIKNQNLHNLYGGKVTKKKVKTTIDASKQESSQSDVNHLSLLKLLSKKQEKKKTYNNFFFNLNDIKRKALWNSSISKEKKKENSTQKSESKNIIDINKLNINIDKPNQRKLTIYPKNNSNKNAILVKSDNQTLTYSKTPKQNKQVEQQLKIQQEIQKYDLTQEQYQIFGNRFPYGFEKIKLLGRGGFSLVWLGQHNKSKKFFAVKQIITKNNHQTHMKQIWFGSMFFTLGGIPKPDFSRSPGIKNLVKMYSYEINQKDTWIFYEKCGNSLGNCLYDIRSQKYGNQKVYKVHYRSLYKKMAKDSTLLKKIIIQICKALVLLSDNLIVHSDLKTQNILLQHDQQISQVKLIDYGSSFSFTQIHQFSMATPQYMSHEILNYILCQNQSPYDDQLLKKVKNYKNPWVIDIWSLGCVILQLINGIPLWMSFPVLIQQGGQVKKKFGLFAVKGRLFQKIIDKQVEVVNNLQKYINENNYSKIKIDDKLMRVLKGMLDLEPDTRISPSQVIKILDEKQQ